MEDWRIYALAFFPELRIDLLDKQTSYYHVFFHAQRILPALYRSDDDATKRVFAFAEWCLNHADVDIVNAAHVAFYEHLFDRYDDWEHAACWIYDDVIKRCWFLWEARAHLLPGALDELRELLTVE